MCNLFHGYCGQRLSLWAAIASVRASIWPYTWLSDLSPSSADNWPTRHPRPTRPRAAWSFLICQGSHPLGMRHNQQPWTSLIMFDKRRHHTINGMADWSGTRLASFFPRIRSDASVQSRNQSANTVQNNYRETSKSETGISSQPNFKWARGENRRAMLISFLRRHPPFSYMTHFLAATLPPGAEEHMNFQWFTGFTNTIRRFRPRCYNGGRRAEAALNGKNLLWGTDPTWDWIHSPLFGLSNPPNRIVAMTVLVCMNTRKLPSIIVRQLPLNRPICMPSIS